MPLNIPNNLPAISYLEEENIFVLDGFRAISQDIRPLKIAVLNLMPLKIETETDLIRLLSNTPLQIELTLLKIGSHIPKNTPAEHMDQFYVDFAEIESQKYDGLIITGAPVENMPFEEVDYWDELVTILNWSKTHVTSTVHICWAAQAGLYHHYGISKHLLKQKMFGVFPHHILVKNHPLFRGFDDVFYVPHSRHTEVKIEDILACPELQLLSVSDEAGAYMVSARNGREIYITGHSEYTAFTLDNEYKRDLSKGLNIQIPRNYYQGDNPNNDPVVRWKAHANLLFSNWLNYFVYQQTPFKIEEIR
ncbi:Homoserine O-succinyltransferase [Bacteroides coprosuis DSM 18011]|uniref:Homoserine O-acetyltransferase n=1 Tax=Bacteroides coprosuis DSM 18011 TaxID=679937 RepID=F3ZSB4_9BACE|nr:homoserine O-succinyltransferase [Bacteroides coprosuis]EGJ70851.1 Homoserine O-succinyltransferase [Bacteroides coprosuis DSM 18011]